MRLSELLLCEENCRHVDYKIHFLTADFEDLWNLVERSCSIWRGVRRDATGVGNLVNRRREQHTASIGGRSVPQLVAREHGSSKQRDFQKQMFAKSSGQLAVMQSKRKASETEPSTSAFKKKEFLQGGEGEGTGEKSPPVTVRARRRLLLLDDHDSDEELFERTVSFNDHGVWNPETSSIGPLRIAFPLNAKREEHPRHTEAAALAATHKADEQSFQHWRCITCTKCKKIRSVNADEEVDISSWCCEKNTQNPKYASCLAPHHEIQEPRNHPNDVEIERKRRVQRKMMWADMVQVDGKHVWWLGLKVKIVPAAIQKIIDEAAADDPGRAVRLFHPPKELELYHVVRKRSLRPFSGTALRNSSSHPDFIVAVTEADKYVTDLD